MSDLTSIRMRTEIAKESDGKTHVIDDFSSMDAGSIIPPFLKTQTYDEMKTGSFKNSSNVHAFSSNMS